MLASIWAYIQDPDHRALLGWIGGGVVVVATALWAVLKFFAGKGPPKPPSGPSVSASNGGVAAGRDIRGNTINTRGGPKDRAHS